MQQKLTELPERRRQEQAEAERLRREQAEAEGLAAAESQEQERQRQVQETERLAQQRQQEAEADARCQTSSEEHLQQLHRPISRRRALQIVGFGGGGLVAAIAANSLLRSDGAISGSGPDDLSPVVVQTVLVNEKGVVTERNSGQVNAFREGLGFGVGLDMVQIPAGEFVMGSPSDEEGRINAEGPQRTVTMSSFFMGRFPVTQTQYRAVMGENPSRFQSNGDHHPVEQVSWRDAVAVCEKLSELTGREYRLPSEAEWEYACRARTQTPFYFGETITTNVVNYNGGFTYGSGSKGDYRRRTTEVGRFPPNAFGLYDMHGNVWEWCADHWHGNYNGMPTDGTAWISSNESSFRLLRGGSWYNSPNYCRSALRYNSRLDYYSINVGFRLVCLATREFL